MSNKSLILYTYLYISLQQRCVNPRYDCYSYHINGFPVFITFRKKVCVIKLRLNLLFLVPKLLIRGLDLLELFENVTRLQFFEAQCMCTSQDKQM